MLMSYQSEYKQRLGAAIFKGSKCIGLGFNKLKSHPRASQDYCSLHAEQDAIISTVRQYKDDLDGCSIYVYREHNKTKKPMLSKPCTICMDMIKNVKIKKVYYTDNTNDRGWSYIKL